MFYAQLNDAGICYAVSNLADTVSNPNMIILDTMDDTLLGKQYVNGVWSNVPPAPIPLSQMQSAKKAQLQTMYAQTLAAGFVSSASGTPTTYGFSQDNRDDMTEVQAAIDAGIETWPIDYGDNLGNIVPLDQAQFTVLESDANRFKWAQVKQLRTLIGQAMAATTVDAVNAIQWVAGTY